jgi:hypothetical protein
MMNVTEAAKSVDVYFELVDKASPEEQIEATFPFQLKTFAISALARGESILYSSAED